MRQLTDEDVSAIASAVVDEIERRANGREVASPRFFTTQAAAAYLGFETPAGIRHLVYSGQIVPDGRGYRRCYVFTRATLDGWVKTRQQRMRGIAGPAIQRSSTRTRRSLKADVDDSMRRIREVISRASGKD